MSYKSQAQLRTDQGFIARWTSCIVEQAMVFKDDARPEFVNLAQSVLRGDMIASQTWGRLLAEMPGFGEHEDQAEITDGDILSAVQFQWPVVAGLMPIPPS